MLAGSTDGGVTFSAPRKLSSSQDNAAAGGRQGSVIRTGPDGTVYVFWQGTWKKQEAIVGVSSSDGGRSFTRPFLVGPVSSLDVVPGASFRVNSFPTATVDQGGNLFVAWTDVLDGHGVITLAKSVDKAASWSLSKAADVSRRTAFYPGRLAAAGNRVFIGFTAIDDVPADTSSGAGVVFYDAYYVLSSDDGTSFGAPARISSASSDPDVSTANSLDQQFLGDYNGAAAGPDGSFWFAWTDTRNGQTCAAVDSFRAGGPQPDLSSCSSGFGNSDIYVARVQP
jgi:hypothetical protein